MNGYTLDRRVDGDELSFRKTIHAGEAVNTSITKSVGMPPKLLKPSRGHPRTLEFGLQNPAEVFVTLSVSCGRGFFTVVVYV